MQFDAECPACGEQFDVPWDAGVWAAEFVRADAVLQEQMLANLRLICPHLTIEWKRP